MARPESIISLLDTDLYKLTMQRAIWKYMPDIPVTYTFINRTPDMRFNRRAFHWLQHQLGQLSHLSLTADERRYLHLTCPYFPSAYLDFLASFTFRPAEHIKLSFAPLQQGTADDSPAAEEVDDADEEEEEEEEEEEDWGHVRMEVKGLWVDTILYEIPVLALTSEAYFRFCDRDWTYDGQEEQAYRKAMQLLGNGCVFSEFGTRRRRDYRTMQLLMTGLTRAARDAQGKGYEGQLSGTSNVHFAMKFGLRPVGTIAHEWFMGTASVADDYRLANELSLRYWVGCFGEGVLDVALTDTFGTPAFLKAFRQRMPSVEEVEKGGVESAAARLILEAAKPAVGGANGTTVGKSYAECFAGVRQDSGDPLEFVKTMRAFYDEENITDRKLIMFSDALDVAKCMRYKKAAEAAGFAPTFGIGTHFSNDFMDSSGAAKSAALNIVMKLSSASGRPAVKISDDMGKNTGDGDVVEKVKMELGYVEKGGRKGR
ncbi:MAG: hypothetical protein Q9197_001710 [Variospora fuerteventurae]